MDSRLAPQDEALAEQTAVNCRGLTKQDPHAHRDASEVGTAALLVSVQDAEEARLARTLGVPWIDLKQPAVGALGAPEQRIAEQVAEVLGMHRRRSVAAGELAGVSAAELSFLARRFPIVKVGLAELDGSNDWQDQLQWAAQICQQAGATLVPAAYADASRCKGVAVDQLLEFCCHQDWPYLLIDTAVKDGNNLLHWLPMDRLIELASIARRHHVRLVLAGSLRMMDIRQLRTLPVYALGVRGLVCDGVRWSRVSSERVRELVELFGRM